MGGVGYGQHPDVLDTLLGSCVGVALWDRMTKQCGLAHVVLPEGKGKPSRPGKYADTAIEELVIQLVARGAMRAGLKAKIAGGSTMFASKGIRDIGAKNCEAVRKQLARFKIPILAEHVGGEKGRVMIVSLADFSVAIKMGNRHIATI